MFANSGSLRDNERTPQLSLHDPYPRSYQQKPPTTSSSGTHPYSATASSTSLEVRASGQILATPASAEATALRTVPLDSLRAAENSA